VKRILAILAALVLLSGVFAVPAGAAVTGYAAEVARLTNLERANNGRTALATTHGKLSAAAQKRAEEIALKYDPPHFRPDGSTWSTVLGEYGISYRAAGENIAMGQKTPAAVVAAWMNSPGHRSNILGLEVNYNYIGVGVCEKADGTVCWVQLFLNDGTVLTNPGAGRLTGGGVLGLFTRLWYLIEGLFPMIKSFFSF